MLENNQIFIQIKDVREKKQDVEKLIHKVKDDALYSHEDRFFLARTLENLQIEEYDLLKQLQGEY